jgi:hypothetical protein
MKSEEEIRNRCEKVYQEYVQRQLPVAKEME